MRRNFKKIAVIFALTALMIAVFALTVGAEKADFTPPAEFSDITPANGWVQIGTKTGAEAVDEDGKDIALYYVNGANVYLNKNTKTIAFVGKDARLTGDYGDNLVNANKNTPGKRYFLVYWAVENSEMVEHIEYRDCGIFNNPGYITSQFKHVKTIKLNKSAYGIGGTSTQTALCTGMLSLTTLGHGDFAPDGKFTPTSYKEGVIDLTGFTHLQPKAGNYDGKATLFAGGLFYHCESIKEVILPKSATYTGSYKPAVPGGAGWVAGQDAVKAEEDEFGGDYAGIIAKSMFQGAAALERLTVPEGAVLKLIEKNALNGSAIRCIDVKGTVSPNFKIEDGAFGNVAAGAIIRCSRAEDIEVVNRALTAAEITNVKATDMNTEPLPVPKITKIPAAPKWVEVDPATLGATAYGSMSATYTNNWWAYFQETKTLKVYAKKSSYYNELGHGGQCDDGAGWSKYKEEIEHVVVGPSIHKLNADFVNGMTNLKDIEITADITQASGTFDAPKLDTIFVTGMEKVEGQAMMAVAKSNFKLNFSKCAVRSIHMGSTAWAFIGNITPGPKTSTIYFDAPSETFIAYAEENYLNVRNSKDESFGEWYVEVPEGLPFCGPTAVFDFDEETGTLSILGKGSVSDVANYWGGGSKNQPWFSVRNNIKHVIISDNINTLGKYTFTECKNLETVELPAKAGLAILSAAFEDCHNLKSVYLRGNQPVEGTVDLSLMDAFESYTFSDCFLIANAVIGEKVDKIGKSVFDNCVNLQNIYGVPGSYAEEYAKENELTFFDKATSTPQPITCTPPAETTEPVDTTDPVAPETTDTVAPETTTPVEPDTTAPETQPVGGDDQNEEKPNSILPVIIIIAAVVVVAIVVVVVIVVKKKKAPKADKE